MHMKVELAYLPLPLLCKRFSPCNHPRQPRVLSTTIRSVAVHSSLSIAASRPRKCIFICVISLLSMCLQIQKKKKNEDIIEKRRHFAFSLRVAWLARDLTWCLAAAFCSSSLITLMITQIRLGRNARKLFHPHDKHLSSVNPVPRLGCSLLCL